MPWVVDVVALDLGLDEVDGVGDGPEGEARGGSGAHDAHLGDVFAGFADGGEHPHAEVVGGEEGAHAHEVPEQLDAGASSEFRARGGLLIDVPESLLADHFADDADGAHDLLLAGERIVALLGGIRGTCLPGSGSWRTRSGCSACRSSCPVRIEKYLNTANDPAQKTCHSGR